MKRRSIIYLIILPLISFQSVLAQTHPVYFSKLDSLQGERIGKINGICQDPDGIMWFCGQGNSCLYRFDGNTLTSFKHDNKNPNSLGFSHLETIYVDDQGMIWIGGEGLDRYNPATGIFKHFMKDTQYPYVQCISKDHSGNIWIGTFDGLYKMDEKTGQFKTYKNEAGKPNSLSSNLVEFLYEDKRGTLWIGTGIPYIPNGPGGLNKMNADESFTRYLHDPKNPNSLISNKIRYLFEDSKKNFWVGTSLGGLHIMDRDKGSFQRFLYDPKRPLQLSSPKPNPSRPDGITYIGEDKSGAIWMGSYASGISRYDPVTKQMSRYRNSNGFPDTSVFKGFIGQDGTLWVATEEFDKPTALLFRGDPGAKTIPYFKTGYPVNYVNVQNDSTMWIGGTNGLEQFDKNHQLIHRYKHDPSDSTSIMNNTVHRIFQRPGQDSFWVGTHHGLNLFNLHTKKFSVPKIQGTLVGIDDYYVVDISQDRNGNLWVATIGAGLLKFPADGSLVKQWIITSDNKLAGKGDWVISVIVDSSSQDIWVGTSGIRKLSRATEKFNVYLPDKVGVYLFQDHAGVIWAGTNNGLYRYDKKKDNFFPYFDSDLPASYLRIFGITEDLENNLWINTPLQLLKINANRTGIFAFGEKYGKVPFFSVVKSIYRSAADQIFFGTPEGYYAFYPADLNINMQPLKISITDFFFNSKADSSRKDSSYLFSAENKNNISLDYDQNNFGFRFNVKNYYLPEKIHYYTQLENYDPTWHETSIENLVYYFNLVPGNYTFRVKAINGDQVKGEREISIHISPPWWKTWWAYGLYFVALCGFIYLIVRSQKKQAIQNERNRNQEKELAQAKEVSKAYTELKLTQAQLIQSEKMASLGELTAGIAHEIQNPLNFVTNFSEVNIELAAELKEEIAKLGLDIKDKSNLEEIANSISDNEQKINHHGKRADGIVKGMLQHSRSSAGKKEETDINQLADEYLKLAYHGLRAKDNSFNASFKTDYDISIGKINIVPQDIGRVLLNLYNNAFYAVSEKKQQSESDFEPLVKVTTKKTDDGIEVIIRDNGNGISQRLMDKIFQPFFTTKPTGQGTGLGLSISFDIIKAHGGEIKVETREGEFTEFMITLNA